MSNAAVYLNPEAYDTSGKALMGRHSAGESFLKGFLDYASVDRLYFWNVADSPRAELETLVGRLSKIDKPVEWIDRNQRNRLKAAGAVHLPSPNLTREAWARRAFGDTAYSLTGITHTTATHRIMDAIGDLTLAPVHPWDAIICTSRAVRDSVRIQLEATAEHLRARLGAAHVPMPRLETIPLGTHTSLFAPAPGAREAWRTKLDIPADDIVALYVGRFSILSKMNPIPMAIALERAARRTKRKLHWVMSGWATDPRLEKRYHEVIATYCPSVKRHVVDGRDPEVRFSIWAVGDLFLSLSDNIQETFGLTPVEAMAAGLPCVVSDWDGYRDTVRHGVDGFRITTYAPRPGLGQDLAYRHASLWDSYDAYVGAASQFVSVDVREATQAIVDLVQNAELRRRMGESAREQAAKAFDWRVIIPRYQALWSELEAVRRSGVEPPKTRNENDNPWRLDPFRQFASYPSEWLTATNGLTLAPGMTQAKAAELWTKPLVRMAGHVLPTNAEAERIIVLLGKAKRATAGDIISAFPKPRRPIIERGLLWMAKYGLLIVLSRSSDQPDPYV